MHRLQFAPMFDHTDLQIWKRSHALSLAVDRALERRTKRGPAGMAAQLSRSCSSIPANIAEGSGCNSPAQTAHFLDIAISSSSETQNHLERARDLGVIPVGIADTLSAELREIRRMILGFKRWVLRSSYHSL